MILMDMVFIGNSNMLISFPAQFSTQWKKVKKNLKSERSISSFRREVEFIKGLENLCYYQLNKTFCTLFRMI